MIQLTINGSSQQLDIDPDTPLLWAIRDSIGLTVATGQRFDRLPWRLSA